MKIAELFVKLGVEGASLSVKALKKVGTGVLGLKKKFLVLAAIIGGVVAGIRKMTGSAFKSSQGLVQLGLTTGLSTKRIQQWEHAGIKFRSTAEEVRSSIASLHEALTAQHFEGQPISGFGLLENFVGFDKKRMTDTFYVLGKLQELAQKDLKPQVITNTLESFGLQKSVIAAMMQGAFKPENFKDAIIHSDKQLENLRAMEAQWKLIGNRIAKSFGMFVEVWGPKMIDMVNQLAIGVEGLLQALTMLGNFLSGESFKTMAKTIKIDPLESFKLLENRFKEVPAGANRSGNTINHNNNINATTNVTSEKKLDEKETTTRVIQGVQKMLRQSQSQSQGI